MHVNSLYLPILLLTEKIHQDEYTLFGEGV